MATSLSSSLRFKEAIAFDERKLNNMIAMRHSWGQCKRTLIRIKGALAIFTAAEEENEHEVAASNNHN